MSFTFEASDGENEDFSVPVISWNNVELAAATIEEDSRPLLEQPEDESNFPSTSKTLKTHPVEFSNDEDDDDNDDDDGMVDWEDAEKNNDDDDVDKQDVGVAAATEEQSINRPLLLFPELRAVTVDLGKPGPPTGGKNDKDSVRKRRSRRRNVWKFQQLPRALQITLQNLQYVHLLAWISHVTYCSLPDRIITETQLACAMSYIPTTFFLAKTTTIAADNGFISPTLLEVQDFMVWYKEWLDFQLHPILRQQRRRPRQGRQTRRKHVALAAVSENQPRSWQQAFENWISALLHEVQLDNNNEEVHRGFSSSPSSSLFHSQWHLLFSNLLCCALMRHGLGWRVRWCMALGSVTGLDLTVSHPWFATIASTRDVVQAAAATATCPKNYSNNNIASKKKATLPSSLSSSPSVDAASPPAIIRPPPSEGPKTANNDIVNKNNQGKKRRRSNTDDGNTSQPIQQQQQPLNTVIASPGWGWMEVRCRTSATSNNANGSLAAKHQWVHADVNTSTCTHGRNQNRDYNLLLNQPSTVEPKVAELEAARSESFAEHDIADTGFASAPPPTVYQKLHKKRKRSVSTATASAPVAFVLAVEQSMDGKYCRYSDVTPRYAASRVATLEQRGLSRTEIQNELSNKLPSEQSAWWYRTLRTLNHPQHVDQANPVPAVPAARSPGGSCCQDAIILDDIASENCKPRAKPSSQTNMQKENQGKITVNPDEDGDWKPAAKPRAIKRHPPVAHDEEDDEDVSFVNSPSVNTNEPMPKSKSGFQNHPVYALKSKLGKTQVVAPTAKMCGIFAGEAVYLRKDVSTGLEAHAWLYRNRKVKTEDLSSPVVRLQARKKGIKKGFQALSSYNVGKGNDGSEEQRAAQVAAASLPEDDEKERLLYGEWQTDPWSPPAVGPHDEIPVNIHKNVELALLNPGLVHIDIPGAAVQAAKQLGVPYAPCLIGFGNNGTGNPVIRGIVVHEVNAEMITQAAEQINQHKAEKEHSEHEHAVYRKWKKLMQGILIKQRLDLEYGEQNGSDCDIGEIE